MRSRRRESVVSAIMVSLQRVEHVCEQARVARRQSLSDWLIEDAQIELDRARQMVRRLPRTRRYARLRAALRRLRPIVSSYNLYWAISGMTDVVHEAELIRDEIKIPDAWAVQKSLARLAARLLPVRNRIRYQEEFEAELVELAQASRIRQVRHTLRIVVRTVPLRRELRRAVRERVR